jgi:multicomponent Na+:H+ antiporter subunit B
MNSTILQIASKYLRGLLLIFAALALFRGHNHPGGGFIGGLMAGLALVYEGLAFNTFQVKQRLEDKPERFVAVGLLILLLSFFPSVLLGYELMTGVWIRIPLPGVPEIKLGTPFLFDVGVFFAVIGVTLLFVFSLSQKK